MHEHTYCGRYTESDARDVVDEIVRNGVQNYSVGQKFELRDKRPTPALDLCAVDGKSVRKFQTVWYTKYPWLTGSRTKKKLFCYYCLLFRGDGKWSREGVAMTKNFLRKANTHAISEKHLRCHEKFKLLGKNRIDHASSSSEGRRLAALKHNEHVGAYRRVLSRLICVVCRLGVLEVPPHCPDDDGTPPNKGDHSELRSLLSQEEQFREHFMSNSIFRETPTGDVQNDLVACVTQVLNAQIMNELRKARFVTVQADETTDVSCRSQISIILRYVIDNTIEERFVGFVDVSDDKTITGLSNTVLNEIDKWDIKDKIVCQTYDGATAMVEREGSVQGIIKKIYPNAMFMHCYAHQLNLVFLHGSKAIKAVRIFIGDLTMFHEFFSRSPKRNQLLREKGFNLPESCEIEWNFQSRAVTTISANFKEIQRVIVQVMDDEDWDPTSLSLACVLLQKMSDYKFVFLLCLFNIICIISDQLSLLLQEKSTTDVQCCVNEITKISEQLKDLRSEETVLTCCKLAEGLYSEFECSEKHFDDLKCLAFEILDTIILQNNIRFQDVDLLQFTEIANNTLFKVYKTNFPTEKLQRLESRFPGVFDLERLKNELTIIYNKPDKNLPTKELLNYICTGMNFF